MTAAAIRNTFLDFFASKGHKIVSSAPIVVKDDPTLLFTNAGMNQFKEYFLGNKAPKQTRVTNTQKCLRVSGKHNDLEEVGVDTYHHTMFEMIGNWSFGDYFKTEAIDWAWELLTKVYKLDADRIYITIFSGDANDGLALDQEATDIWKKWVPADRILPFDRKDNFWEMGETGPCGPCSEIHIDLRPEAERKKIDGATLVNQDHPQVIEIWNLVFIEFNRKENGQLEKLANQHIDTGMGFERLVRAIQAKQSNYDTDVFGALIQQVEKTSNIRYGQQEQTDIAIRVIVDHIRAISFAIADGQLPSNTGAGYVIRRILRRAVRYGYTFLNQNEPFIHQLVATLSNEMGQAFPELKMQQAFIVNVILEEEKSFLNTLEQGLKRLDLIETELKSQQTTTISGEKSFELYDTYGFPKDLTQLIASEKGLTIDEAGFEKALQTQKNRSKKDATTQQSDWQVVFEDDQEEFVGYDYLESPVKITRYRAVEAKEKKQYQLVFNLTPFYPEGGGQVGDTGYIQLGDQKISIVNTVKENNLIIHVSNELPSDLAATYQAVVHATKRNTSASNHTATHLLHAALQETLGEHVQQKGSLVAPTHLRFDFSHFSKLTEDELQTIEKRVNQQIRANIALQEDRNMPFQKALDKGATALFGEKYGDTVRMITFDPAYSMELCGGTHVQATGTIGLFTITQETAVAAGVRRIEALTGQAAYDYLHKGHSLLNQVGQLIKKPGKELTGVQQLLDENKKLKSQIEQQQQQQAKQLQVELLNKVSEVNGIPFLAAIVDAPSADTLKQLANQLKQQQQAFIVLAAAIDNKPNLVISIDETLIKTHDLNASQLIRQWAPAIKGGGGGQPFLATAGGKDVNGLGEVVRLAEEFVEHRISNDD